MANLRTSPGKRVNLNQDERGVSYGSRPDGSRFYVAPSPHYNPATKQIERGDPNSEQSFFTNKDWNTETGNYDSSVNWGNVVGLGTLAAIATPAAFAAAGGGAAGSGVLASSNVPAGAATAPSLAGTAGTVSGTGAGMAGKFGSLFGKMDPTTLLLSALSMFGGDDGGQERQSFREPGQITDPKQALYQALSGLYRGGQGLAEKTPTRLRSSVVQRGPEPVSIPGLGFQIGGGLGHDPALDDPTMLDSRPMSDGIQKYDPFQSIAQGQFNQPKRTGSPR